MSGEELRVEPGTLRRHAKGFSTGGEELEQIFDRLDAVLSAEGKCWGADETGQQFEQGYEKPRQAAYDTFGELPGALKDIRTGLDKMAKNFQDAEDASTVRG
jgi:uncharacterized protein YukE